MKTRLACGLVALVLVVSELLINQRLFAGVGISTAPDEVQAPDTPPTVTARPFRYYRLRQNDWPLAYRDLEFWISDTYRQKGKNLAPFLRTNDNNEVGRLGRVLCEDQDNPFGFDERTDISLVYDYLNKRNIFVAGTTRRDTVYNTDPEEIGFLVAGLADTLTFPSVEARHVDLYIHTPASVCTPGHEAFDSLWCASNSTYPGDQSADGVANGATFPSPWQWTSEDSATSASTLLHANSISFTGPQLGAVVDSGTVQTAWSLAGGGANWTAMHEFAHCMNAHSGGVYDELQGLAAEALIGELPAQPRYDDRYIRSLLWISNETKLYQNYEGGRGLMSYIAYNFRGADTSGTDAGIRDDVLYRWGSRNMSRLGSLATSLASESAGYLQGLSNHDRLQVLIQNWRVANYVNKSSLAEGQYGYPPQFGFRPDRDLGSWKDNDGIPGNNAQSIPPEVWIHRDSTLRFQSEVRGSAGCTGCSWPMRIQPYGAEYWVVSADPSMVSADRTLQVVARIADPCGVSTKNGRLMMSAILYSQRSDTANTLWRHPEWATGVIGPIWAEFKQGPSMPVEIRIPGFGSTDGPKAAVIVLSHGDGNESFWSGTTTGAGVANWDTCVTDTTCPGEAILTFPGHIPPYPKSPY